MAADTHADLLPPAAVVDEDALRAEITALHAAKESDLAFRTNVSKLLHAAWVTGTGTIRECFLESEHAGLKAARSVAAMTDSFVRLAADAAAALHPTSNPTDAERLSVVAVGGYGRGEMAPYSDVDLLFLVPPKHAASVENAVETMLYVLWDMKLKVGHAVRDGEACLRLARDDMTIRTTLLETRLVCGDAAQLVDLQRRAEEQLFRKAGREFVDAKLEERDGRHERAGGSRYLLNPDIKDGKGGLRDLQTLYWLAKCMHGSVPLAELVRLGIFEPDEALALAQAERDLWTWRFHLHYAAGRAEERLHFEHQEKIAEALGYPEQAGLKPVEVFMRDYYKVAKEVGDLTRIFCAALEQRQEKRRPVVGRFLARFTGSSSDGGMVDGFPLQSGRIRLADPERLRDDPIQILRLFRTSQKHDAHIHPDAYRGIVQNFFYIDDAVRSDPEANRVFLAILTARENPVRILRRMSETGVLGQFLPEFGHITGLMQFDTLHHYTVDEHTLLALDTLFQIETGARRDAHPLASELVSAIAARRALYLALLFHDIGKGRGGDHSEKGAEIASRVCPRLGLDSAEAETVVWLVRHHLVMSNTAQRRDLSDPATVREFAALVQERERLNLLLVLTVCDLTSVAPDYWNEWKAQLLRDLYQGALQTITAGQDARASDQPVIEARAALQSRLADVPGDALQRFIDSNGPAFWFGLDSATHETLARMALDGSANGSIQLEHDGQRRATRVCVHAQDRDGLLADLAAALAAAGASVSELRTYTSDDGHCYSAFWVQSETGADLDSNVDLDRIQARLAEALAGDVPRPAAVMARGTTGARPAVPVRVRLANDASDLHTLVEVTAQDRPGLLADLTRAFADANTKIVSTIATTYGERAVDSFYIKDSFGLKLSSDSALRAVEEQVRAAAAPKVRTPA